MKPQRTMSPFTYQAVTEKTQHSHLFLGSSFFIEKKKKKPSISAWNPKPWTMSLIQSS